MEQLEIVFLTTVVVAVLCISFSTWVTLSDLRAAVFESAASQPAHVQVQGGALQSFAHHAAEHLPHGIRLSGRDSASFFHALVQCLVCYISRLQAPPQQRAKIRLSQCCHQSSRIELASAMYSHTQSVHSSPESMQLCCAVF
jgi:hypothetical protein